MPDVVEPKPPRGSGRHAHRALKHAARGALVKCTECDSWFRCVRHREFTGCRYEAVKWWQLRLRTKIAEAILAEREDGDD